MNFGNLYIIATPIGNLSDITLRALEILKSVDLILAEDTRVTSKLLYHYDIDNNIKSYNQHSTINKKLEILNYLNQGKNLGLVTDAGTPGISDPGNELIQFISENNPQIRIIPIPGPSSVVTAASVSGFKMGEFIFIGYFPKKKQSRTLKLITTSKIPIVYLDSPNRLVKNLETISTFVKNRQIFVARELTKIHEEIFRGTVLDVLDKLSNTNPKGEVIVIIAP